MGPLYGCGQKQSCKRAALRTQIIIPSEPCSYTRIVCRSKRYDTLCLKPTHRLPIACALSACKSTILFHEIRVSRFLYIRRRPSTCICAYLVFRADPTLSFCESPICYSRPHPSDMALLRHGLRYVVGQVSKRESAEYTSMCSICQHASASNRQYHSGGWFHGCVRFRHARRRRMLTVRSAYIVSIAWHSQVRLHCPVP